MGVRKTSRRRMLMLRGIYVMMGLALSFGLSACSLDDESTEVVEVGEDAGQEMVEVTIGLPYQADVQFTPVYVADAEGHFAEAGPVALEPSFEYGFEFDFLPLLVSGDMDAVVASGEQVILAREQGLPVVFVASWYQRFPVVVASLETELGDAGDLIGLRVGIPERGGASWIGWQALLARSGIPLDSVEVEEVGYAQLEALRAGQVDAVVGYAANEPVQLRAQDEEVSVLEIADRFNLVSNGIVVSEEAVRERPEVVQAIVSAMLEGLRTTLEDPDAAFEIALDAVPAADDDAVRDTQREVLEASLPFWEVEAGERLGAIDRRAWEASVDFLREIGLIESEMAASEMTVGRFVDQADLRR